MASTTQASQPVALGKSLTVGSAVALALAMVIGAGLLVLPGVAYQEAGSASVYAWGLCALLVVPLLVVFASLGARYPNAGGIAGFVRVAFGPACGSATEVLLLGTFSLGIPAIALVGGNYLAMALGAGNAAALVAAHVLLLLAGAINWAGASLSGNVQKVVSYALVALLAVVALSAFAFGDLTQGAGVSSPGTWAAAIPCLGTVFFAFTGWEMLSFTTEEYRNPRRDYPLSVAVSFGIVVALYAALVLAVQLTLPPDDPRLSSAPIAAVLARVFGEAAGKTVALMAVLLVGANINGATWAASRLVFSSSREGLLPSALARVHSRARIPRVAVTVTTIMFVVVLGLCSLGILSLGTLFQLAGQNFFLLYLLSVLAYMKLSASKVAVVFGGGTLLLCLGVMGSFGWTLLYPAVLILAGILLARVRAGTRPGSRN